MSFAEVGNPLDRGIMHIFIWSQIDIFWPFPIIYDVFRADGAIWFTVDDGDEAFYIGALCMVEKLLLLFFTKRTDLYGNFSFGDFRIFKFLF